MHRDIVAWGFRIWGLVLGLPSLVGLALVLVARFSGGGKTADGEYLDVGTYGITGLIANGAKGVGRVFEWLGGIASWIEGALAVVLGVLVVAGAALFFIGRGIARHAPGAATFGIVLLVIFALVWAVVLLSVNRNAAMAVPALGLAMSLYAIWVLGWR
jgi:hypothetical protein